MANSWLDTPIVTSLLYSEKLIYYFLIYARNIGTILGILGLLWSGFQLVNSRLQIKEMFWGTIYKWVIFLVLINLYPTITKGVMGLANQIGLEVGGGDIVRNEIVSMREKIRARLNAGVPSDQEQQEFANYCKQFITKIPEYEPTEQYWGDYVNEIKAQIEKNGTNWGFLSGSTMKNERGNDTQIKQKDFTDRMQTYSELFPEDEYKNLMKQYKAIEDIIVIKDKKTGKVQMDLTESYFTLDLYISYTDKNGDLVQTNYFSPASLLRIALFAGKMLWYKAVDIFIAFKNENLKDFSLLQVGESISSSFAMIWEEIKLTLLGALMAAAAVFSMAFVGLEYLVALVEYLFVSGIAAFLVPFILLDPTKDMTKKLVPVFTGFFMKIIVLDIVIMFSTYLFVQFCNETIVNINEIDLTAIVTVVFNCLLVIFLAKKGPEMANTLMTGQPNFTMGDIANTARAVGGTAIAGLKGGAWAGRTAGKVAAAGGKTLGAVGRGARDVVSGMVSTGMKTSGARTSAMEAARNDGADVRTQRAAGRKAVGDTIRGDLVSRAKNSLSNAGDSLKTGAYNAGSKALQFFGDNRASQEWKDKADQVQQQKKERNETNNRQLVSNMDEKGNRTDEVTKTSSSNHSNADFFHAYNKSMMKDENGKVNENTARQTWTEHSEEKKRQGSAIGLQAYGKMKGAGKSNGPSDASLPESLTGNTRASSGTVSPSAFPEHSPANEPVSSQADNSAKAEETSRMPKQNPPSQKKGE